MTKYMIAILIGGAIGGLLGARGSCTTGACPLTSNPYIGSLYGAVLGFFLISAIFGTTTQGAMKENIAMATTTATTAMTTTTTTAAEKATEVVVAEIKNNEEFKKQVLEAKVPVLVDLWASWCGPCRAQSPIVDEVATKVGDKALVVKVNVDEASDVAESLNVSSIPTLIVFNKGKEVKRFVGVQSANTLSRALDIK